VLDLGIDLELWPWVWLGIAVFFAVIELTVLAGTFVLLPFAISAFLAALLGFYDAPVELQWLAFLGGGGVLWIGLYRYLKRFAKNNQMAPGVGADRVVGLPAIVLADIDPEDTDRRGRVSINGEVWGALPASDERLTKGAHVRVVAVNGTRVVVRSDEATRPDHPPAGPPMTSSPPPPSPPPPSPPSTS
jgi:membrane protein implicated in regulation of membrane protease activity